MKAPAFWYHPFGFKAALLSPFSCLYGLFALIHRVCAKPQSVDVPVICLGNVTIGGAGKTPCVMALTKLLQYQGYQVHILSRGYGGRLKGPVRVDPEAHTDLDVGDEPLLLSRIAPTWVAKNRYSGARAAQADGAKIIVMDDGLQNNELHKDFNILIVDHTLGFGNGALLPSGPLREPVKTAINKAQALFLTGRTLGGSTKLIHQSTYRVTTHLVSDKLAHKRLFAFSGIAHPQKFYDSLKDMKIELVGTRDFPDHHHFTHEELQSLVKRAKEESAILVTTEKDWVRLTPPWRNQILCIRIENRIEDADHLLSQLAPVLKRVAL